MSVALSLSTLADIPPNVKTPTYRRNQLSCGILHVGIGNFHRAHQAFYLHRLFEMGLDHDWAIVGAGVKDFDEVMRKQLRPQDWLTTVVKLEPNQLSATVTGPMIDFIKSDSQAIINAMAQPNIRIVSMTVTEGGYFIDAETGGFNSLDPDIVADQANPESPKTVFGMIIAALMKRRASGIPAFTVMSCDNLPENGEVARRTVLGLADSRTDDTCEWIAEHVAFPCSMVDCITPATGERERAIVKNEFGIEDAAPVVCEPFAQWVMEDHFSDGRPALEKVGVQFVENVAPYELMKLRILNGGHAAIAYPAGLMDIHYVHDAMTDKRVAGFLDKLVNDEIIPTVALIPGVDFKCYYEEVVERFSNEAIGDTIPRLCFDGSNRQPKFILPAVQARLSTNQSVTGLALVSALWCRYCYGSSDSGQQILPNDPNWDQLTSKAKAAKDNPLVWLQMTEIYSQLSEDPDFVAQFSNALNSLWQNGVAASLDAYISS